MLSIVKVLIWKGLTTTNKSYEGKEYFRSKTQLRLELQRQDIFINYIRTRWIIRFIKPVKMQEIFLFTRQIARLLQAGIPLLQILQLLEASINNTTLQEYLQKLIAELEEGFSLNEALQENKIYFNKFHCSLIALGEKTATLGLMFERIAAYQEKNMKLKAKIINALVYPAVVLIVAILVFIALLMGVVPQFEQFFSDVGAQLPLITRIVIHLSKHIGFICSYCGLFLLILGGFFIFLKKRYPIVDNKLDVFYLKIPLLKKIISEIIIARITRALSTALAAGLPLLDALQLIAEISGNFVYKSAILMSCEQIRDGEGFYQAFSRQKVMPLDLLQLIKIGEMANCLSEILNNTADIYEEKMNYFADNLSVLLEPLLIIILGLMVSGLVIAMYLPIFKLGSVI
ncbi:type II secretion system F family protein [Rickettsiella endosymbiont of Miltochrista miniata]|uniref:type II secretion system F family protein n=1 Tax=Rickettsiella endosymbiont of Miltochrista miniata TaxID=3066239 RepID=UPI00313AC666